ncbi:cationic amino acid transporter 2 [Anabrus simplex]|uniref:cationic amino acid transporter 2 n=1 Tax=Anabrus simplex TaxID=316456 RepID=UPI0035A299BA
MDSLCHAELDGTTSKLGPGTLRRRSRRRHTCCCSSRDAANFVVLWCGLLAYTSAVAVCARGLSAAMDYIAGGRSQHWVQDRLGPLPAVLGGALPDPIALGVTMVPSLLFMLGLEHSPGLRLLLNVGVAGALAFFVSVGSMQADMSNWTENISELSGWSSLLTGAAICSFGFIGYVDVTSEAKQHNPRLRTTAGAAAVLLALLSYCVMAIVLTMMVNYQALHESAVPLLKAFELRDVDWARLVMAVLSILGLALALVEVCTPLHAGIVILGGEEWRVLPVALARESALTGTPVLAILVAGVAAGTLALLCPLRALLRLMSVGPLLQHAVTAAAIIQHRYRPPDKEQASSSTTRYRRLARSTPSATRGDDYDDLCGDDEDDPDNQRLRRHRLTVRCLKSGLGFLPAALRQTQQQHYYTSLSIASPDQEQEVSGASTVATSLSATPRSARSSHEAKYLINASINSLRSIASLNLDDGDQVDPKPHDSNHISSGVETKHIMNGSVVISNGYCGRFTGDAEMLLSTETEPVQEDSTRPNKGVAYCNERFVENATSESEHGESASSSVSSSSSDAEAEDSSSSTDIDAIVAEYKERIKVATTMTGTPLPVQEPSAATSRRVSFALCGALACMVFLGAASIMPSVARIWCAIAFLIGTLLFLVVIARQPQNKATQRSTSHIIPLVPWLPAAGMATNLILCAQQLVLGVWPIALGWLALGCVLFIRHHGHSWQCCRPSRGGCGSSSRRERIRLHAPPRQSMVSTLIPSHRQLPEERARRLTQVDTILISR